MGLWAAETAMATRWERALGSRDRHDNALGDGSGQPRPPWQRVGRWLWAAETAMATRWERVLGSRDRHGNALGDGSGQPRPPWQRVGRWFRAAENGRRWSGASARDQRGDGTLRCAHEAAGGAGPSHPQAASQSAPAASGAVLGGEREERALWGLCAAGCQDCAESRWTPGPVTSMGRGLAAATARRPGATSAVGCLGPAPPAGTPQRQPRAASREPREPGGTRSEEAVRVRHVPAGLAVR
jgi:hypothetical protein